MKVGVATVRSDKDVRKDENKEESVKSGKTEVPGDFDGQS